MVVYSLEEGKITTQENPYFRFRCENISTEPLTHGASCSIRI